MDDLEQPRYCDRLGHDVGAGLVLYRVLHQVDTAKVMAAMHGTSWRCIAFAGVFVIGGYACLTLYDRFALRSISRSDVSYGTAALASFTSYTIGHNLGVMVLTGSMVRLRIYAPWGLGITEVAKIAFLTGLTFWLGNIVVLGVALIWAPDAATAVTQTPGWINRLLGFAGLISILGYVVWLLPRPRVIGHFSWQITLPDARLSLVQIGIGILDFAAGSLAFYMLMPQAHALAFPGVAVVFVSATLLGFLSHAPGSLGVFDATMLLALPVLDTEALLASLLLFRLLYFVGPFVFALILLGIREFWISRSHRPQTVGRKRNVVGAPAVAKAVQ